MNQLLEGKISMILIIASLLTVIGNFVYPLLPAASIVATMMLLVGIDTFFGVWLGLKRKSFSSRRFGDAIKKLITYFLVMLASNAVSVHLVGDTVNYTLSWVNHAVYSLILARELLSIFEKTHLLGYFTLPKWLEEKFEAFENQQPSKNTDGKN